MSSLFSSGLFILTSAASNNKCLTVFFAEQDKSVHCTDECRALGHSDRCWMPKLRVGSQADSADNRTNLFIPVGMDAMVETEIYGTISCNSRKTLTTFGKEQRDSTILVANVKPYLKSQRALSPPLQESPSASSSPTKSSTPLDLANQESKEERNGESDSSAYGPPDGQCSPLHTELEEPSYLTCELRPKSLSSSLIHSSVISQECGGSDCALDPRDSGNWQVRRSPAKRLTTTPRIDDRELIYFEPQRCLNTHCITKNHPLSMFSFLFVRLFRSVFSSWLVVFRWTVCPWPMWGFWAGGEGGSGEGISAYLTSSVSMVYCTCQFRCLYFTHFRLQFCEAIEQIATVTLQVPSAFVQWSSLSPFSV